MDNRTKGKVRTVRTQDFHFYSGPRLKLAGRMYLPDEGKANGAGGVFCVGFGGVKEWTPVGLCTLLADYAYWSSYQIEWSNFASWLLIGGMAFLTLALLFALIDLFRNKRGLIYALVLATTWILGFLNSLQHARDAWAIMPAALVLSVIVAVLACVATWIGFSSQRAGGAK